MPDKSKKSRWDYLGKKLETEEELKEKFGQLIHGKPSFAAEEHKAEKDMKEEKVSEGKKVALTIMKWFQGNCLRMCFGLTFVWCTGLFLFLILAGPEFTIIQGIFMSLFLGMSGAMHTVALSTDPIARLDEKWAEAIAEGRLPWWVGLIRLVVVVLPYYFCGWVPKKAYDWYFYKFTSLHIGLRLYEEGRYREAIAEVEQFKAPKSHVEQNPLRYLLLGHYYVATEEHDRYMLLGHCYTAIEEHNKAVVAYQQAISYKPDDLTAQTSLATAYILSNQHNEGLALSRKLHQQFPENTEVLGIMARSYIILGMYDDALNHVKEALSLEPMEPIFHKMLAEVYLGKGMKDEAIGSASKALSLNPPQWIGDEAQTIINIAKGH
ncbi:MAG: Beta-barrel assembly-enhancing protease [Syntrophomonadaceae bacterium]|nr:Beta-barrel assembly-enhancing protease [Bacillota bacterium]